MSPQIRETMGNNQLKHTFPVNRHGFTPRKPIEGGDGAAYAEPLRSYMKG